MKRLFFLIVLLACVGCEKYQYSTFDKDYNPFFRTQWVALEEDGTLVRDNLIVFDFDYYDANSLSIYMAYNNTLQDEYTQMTREHFTSQSYKTNRVADETWVINNFYINGSYCKIVIQIIDLYGNPDYANVAIYQNNFLIKEFVIVKNYEYIDINSLVGDYGTGYGEEYTPSPM